MAEATLGAAVLILIAIVYFGMTLAQATENVPAVAGLLEKLARKVDRLMGVLDDLTNAVNTTIPDVTAALTDLVAAVKAGQPPTPAQIAAAEAAITALGTLDAAAKGDDPGAPAAPPASPPSP